MVHGTQTWPPHEVGGRRTDIAKKVTSSTEVTLGDMRRDHTVEAARASKLTELNDPAM